MAPREGLTAAGLLAASVGVLVGTVLAVNPARFGATGVVGGALLIGAGILAAIRLFHRSG